jgi:hypothetical protein
MTLTDLQSVANTVVLRAQQRGYVIPREIREELASSGLAEEQWKEVVDLARPALYFRQGRYYYVTAVSPRLRAEQTQQEQIQQAIRHWIRRHKQNSAAIERRRQDRIDFIQPLKVRTEDDREFTLVSRDLSTTGIRLIGTRSLLGQKIRVYLQAEQEEPTIFVVRVLWTCAIGEDLFENGGAFLEVISAERPQFEVVG